MPAQTSSPRVEELRARLKAEPKSRHFFPLGEELRKLGRLEESEQVLREGLTNHPQYLSAWTSLGRVLREQQKHEEALGALNNAFALDGGNVVTARLLGDTYLLLGNKLEAIKKYKLVHALMPAADEELESLIDKLDRDLNPERYQASPAAEPVEEIDEGQVFEEPSLAASIEDAPTSEYQTILPAEIAAGFGVTSPGGSHPLPGDDRANAIETRGDDVEASAPSRVEEDIFSQTQPYRPVEAQFSSAENEPFGNVVSAAVESNHVTESLGPHDSPFSDTNPVLSREARAFSEEHDVFAEDGVAVGRSADGAEDEANAVEGHAEPAAPAPTAESDIARTRASIARLQTWLTRVKGEGDV